MNKVISIITMDTNGLDLHDEIICICAKKYKIEDNRLVFIDSFSRFYIPKDGFNTKAQEYHKWNENNIRDMIDKLIEKDKIQNADESESFDKSSAEFFKFIKDTTIVTNSKDFLVKKLHKYARTEDEIKTLHSNRKLGIIEDMEKFVKVKNDLGYVKRPTLLNVAEFYSVDKEYTKVLDNALHKNKLTTAIFYKILHFEPKFVEKIINSDIRNINLKNFDNFDNMFDSIKGNLSTNPEINKIKHSDKFSKLEIGVIDRKDIPIKDKHYNYFDKLNIDEIVIAKIKNDYVFSDISGNIIGTTAKDFNLKVGVVSEDSMHTDNIFEYLSKFYDGHNIHYKPFTTIK